MTINEINQPSFESKRPDQIRFDLRLIADMINPNTRVLDVGCDDGQLLRHLSKHKNVVGRGIEISQTGVNACVARGLSVVQGDADTDLGNYPPQAFDYVVLSQTLQATHNPLNVVSELVRIGKKAIISFPNFGFWQVRFSLLTNGRMPKTIALKDDWFKTPNIHLCTILDFIDLCNQLDIKIEKQIPLNSKGETLPLSNPNWLANFFGVQAIYQLSKEKDS